MGSKQLSLSDADSDGYSLLHALAQHNYPDLVALLCEKGMWGARSKSECIDARDKWGVTPLMLASLNGNEQCVAVLLRHGADRSIADSKGVSAEAWAQRNGHSAVAASIRDARQT